MPQAIKSKPLLFVISLYIFLTAICQIVDRVAVYFFHYSLNQQMIFGLVLNNALALIISLSLTSLFVYLILKLRMSSALIAVFASGAVSNVFDRVFYGGVVDYINFFGFSRSNIADILIVSSLILLGLSLIGKQKSIS